MDVGQTALREEDVAKHLATAQSLVTRTVVIEAASRESNTEIAGTRRRFVLGPFYHAEITVNGATVDKVLQKVHREENRWMLTWTLQELYSINERPGKWGLWGGEPPRDEFYINTDDLDCARMGVSAFQNHALVPHEAYQAIYAAGEADKVFAGYQTHIVSGNQVLRRL